MQQAKIAKIISMDGRSVIFHVTPDTAEQALLLVMSAYEAMRSEETTPRRQLLDSLAAIPGLKIPRADRVLESCIRDGDVAALANHSARRYALTDQGRDKAHKAIEHLLTKRK
jgi:hypothetical protein